MGAQSDTEEDGESVDGNQGGCNGVSKFRSDNSISDWLARKDEKKSKSISKNVCRRSRLGGGGQLKRTALKKVSKKQSKVNSSYAKAKQSHYTKEENQVCFLCGTNKSLSIHHSEKRGSNTDKENTFFTLCLMGNYMDLLYPDANHSHHGGCHSFIEANKSIAKELGLL